jgi:hypothetical protein
MARTAEEIEEGCRRMDEQTAHDIMGRADARELEFRLRAAAKFLGRDQDQWEELVPMIEAMEVARLYALRTRVKTPEEMEAWRNYMMNR